MTIEKDTVLASSPKGLSLTIGVQVSKIMLIIFHKTCLLYIGQCDQGIITHKWYKLYMRTFLKVAPIPFWFFLFHLLNHSGAST